MCNGSCLENFQVNRAYQNIVGCTGSEDTLYECNRTRITGCTDVAGVYCGKCGSLLDLHTKVVANMYLHTCKNKHD